MEKQDIQKTIQKTERRIQRKELNKQYMVCEPILHSIPDKSRYETEGLVFGKADRDSACGKHRTKGSRT